MGNIEHIDQLETYIKDLGNEIESVKKASDYLRLIEQFQAKIKQTSSTLVQSRDQLKLINEIVESKLELFQTTVKNIEAKQQSLEQSQLNIISSLEQMKQQQVKNEKGIISSFKEINEMVNHNNTLLINKFNRVQEEQGTIFKEISKFNKVYFAINSFFNVSIIGILVYLLIK